MNRSGTTSVRKQVIQNILFAIAVFAICLVMSVFAEAAGAADGAEFKAAGERIPFNHVNAELTDLAAAISKLTGKKMLLDPSVRGKVTILFPQPVTVEEAYNAFLMALATNGFSVFEQGDVTRVMSSRSIQRAGIETYTTLPDIRQEKMVTYVFKPKYVPVDEINKRLRILPSKDGEMTSFEPSNTLVITDFVSNLHRIDRLLRELDVPAAAKWKSKAVERKEGKPESAKAAPPQAQ